MSNRLDQEREKELQPKRIEYAIEKLENLGFEIVFKCNTRIDFYYKGELIQFYPYSGWHTGKTIKDGRGIKNLLKQLI
jgi:hypothetical protein